MFEKKKYFQKSITQWIVKPLKKHGFKRLNTNNVARLTEDNIVQVINFQKSSWGGNFYVNIRNIPMFYQQYDFSGEGGDRIQDISNIGNKHGSFNYDIKLLGDINFDEIQKTILGTVLPWFNQTSSVKGLLEYNAYLQNDKGVRGFGEVSDKALGYLLLADEQYANARDLFYSQELRKYNKETDSYTHYRNTEYDPVIALIDNNEIESQIETNILYNQMLLKNKLPAFPISTCHLNDTIELIKKSNNKKSKRQFDNGLSYHHHIYDTSKKSRELLTEIETAVKNSREVKRISNHELDIIINDDYRLHFVVNQHSFEEEIPDIVYAYTGSKEIENIINCEERVEFWGDDDSSEVLYINEYILVLEAIEGINNISIYWPQNQTFIDEVNGSGSEPDATDKEEPELQNQEYENYESDDPLEQEFVRNFGLKLFDVIKSTLGKK